MAIQGLDYWYDGTQRRWLEQIVRALSGFQYLTGARNGEPPQLRMVPCRMALRSQMVGQIMRNNSENTLLTCPIITVAQTALAPRRNDMQNPIHVDTKSVHEREIDEVTGEYSGHQGNRYTVKRMMPRPFEMTIQVDLWTSNLDQKHQLMEQILCIFYPDIQIQNSTNGLDWGSRTLLSIEDVSWTSQSVAVGSDSDIDIATIMFKLPMWLSPPAEVTRERVIQQIVTNMNFGEVDEIHTGLDTANTLVTTPGNHHIEVMTSSGEAKIKLLGPKGSEFDSSGNIYPWKQLIEQYGDLRLMETQIRIKRDDDIESDEEIVGTIQYDANNANMLFWQIDIDTLPQNTLPPVNGIIDPHKSNPGSGLPVAQPNQRYLITEDIAMTANWPGLIAAANDVIVFRNGGWAVEFDASAKPLPEHMANLLTGVQLRWTGEQWQLALGGQYAPGLWRVRI